MNMLFEWDRQNPKERTSVKGSAEQIRTANKMIMIYSLLPHHAIVNLSKYFSGIL